ncbi:MAG: hypothetical protein JWM11_6333 [Planctomycetaceae bacterium]|nr:hypothetical protein [Planctomycetaceae bacterium]
MNVVSLDTLFHKLGLKTSVSQRRRSKSQVGCVAENLEQRALLSAVMDLGTDPAIAVDVLAVGRKQVSTYPNLDGTWNLSGTNGTTFTGSVVFQQSSSDSLTGTISIPGASATTLEAHRKGNAVTFDVHPATGNDTHVKGHFNSSHNEITVHSTVANPAGGKSHLTTVIAFDSNSTPLHFTVTISNKKTVEATVQATREIILT